MFLRNWILGNAAPNKDHHRDPVIDQNSLFQDRERILGYSQRSAAPTPPNQLSDNNVTPNNLIPSSYSYGNDSPILVVPTLAGSDVTASDLQNVNSTSEKQTNSSPTYSLFFLNTPLTFLYRLASLWFISIAAGSVLCSIPLSAIGLPFIIGFGIASMFIVFIMSLIFKLWILLLKASWRAVRSMFSGPLRIVGSLWNKAVAIFHGNSPSLIKSSTPYRGRDRSAVRQPLLPINTANNRRFSTSSRLTDRSFDGSSSLMNEHLQHSGKWRYYDPSGGNNEVLQSSFYSSLPSPRQILSPSISDSSKRFDFDQVLPNSNPRVLNAAFHELNVSQRDRLEMCAQLYSLTTNTPMDQIDIGLGLRAETGNTHYILSLWNEPNLNEPLELTHLIGFCEYFVSPSAPSTFHIDKLNISSSYSENGFSKRIIRKLMNTVGCDCIQVWSVWHAESFYKGLGFRNVVEYPTQEEGKITRGPGVKPIRVEGEHGPLLAWHADRLKRTSSLDQYHSAHSSQVKSNVHPDPSTIVGLRTSSSLATLKSKDSSMSLNGGVGAWSARN